MDEVVVGDSGAVNDLDITKDYVYATDSLRSQFYKVQTRRTCVLPMGRNGEACGYNVPLHHWLWTRAGWRPVLGLGERVKLSVHDGLERQVPAQFRRRLLNADHDWLVIVRVLGRSSVEALCRADEASVSRSSVEWHGLRHTSHGRSAGSTCQPHLISSPPPRRFVDRREDSMLVSGSLRGHLVPRRVPTIYLGKSPHAVCPVDISGGRVGFSPFRRA